MMTIFIIAIIAYFFVLIIRRIYKGFYGTWMKKWYFYLEIKMTYYQIIRVKCKRIAYLLNPFAKTVTLVICPPSMQERIRIKIYKPDGTQDGYFQIKNIKGTDTEKEVFMSDGQSYRETKQRLLKKDLGGELNDVWFSDKYPLKFKGKYEKSTLKLYPWKLYTNKELRKINGW